MSWDPESPLIDEEPAPRQGSKITRDTLDPDKYTAFYVKKTRAYIAKHFHPIAPDEAPENVKAPEKAPHLNPVTFLVHNTCSMLYAGVTEDNEPIFNWQYCRICTKWLSTDKHGFLNAERHCNAKHNPQPQSRREVTAAEQVRRDGVWESVLFVIRNLLPIAIAKDRMLNNLKSPYNLWKILADIGIAVESVLKDLLSQVKRLVLIEDGWTDSVRRSYEGIWAAGILPNGDSLTVCIGQIPVKRADAATLARAIAKRLTRLDYTLSQQHRIAYFVGDSAQVNRAMVDAFNKLTGETSQFIPCSAHMLNNMMRAVWTAVRPHIRHLLAVIETLRNRADFRRLAEEKQIQNKIFKQHKRVGVTTIATAISVRWYSLTKMLSSAIELRTVIESYLATSRDAALKRKLMKTYEAQSAEMNEEIPPVQAGQETPASAPSTQHELDDDEPPSDGITRDAFVIDTSSGSQTGIGIDQQEWEIAERANTIFSTFRTVMLQLESDRYGTIANIWRGILAIRHFVEGGSFPETIFGWGDAVKIYQRWVDKCPVLPTNAQKATVISDLGRSPHEINPLSVPLFQFTAVLRPSNLRRISESFVDNETWLHLLRCVKVVFDSVSISRSGIDEFGRGENDSHMHDQPRLFGMEEYEDMSTLLEPEWKRYTELRLLVQDDADLHKWWKDHAHEFPTFYLLAKLYLFIPATSAGVERMFSKSRRILDRLRLRMTPEHAELLVFLRENIAIIEALDRATIEL